jgi:hypothetical protein
MQHGPILNLKNQQIAYVCNNGKVIDRFGNHRYDAAGRKLLDRTTKEVVGWLSEADAVMNGTDDAAERLFPAL